MPDPYPYSFIADIRPDELPSARSQVAGYIVPCPCFPCTGFIRRVLDESQMDTSVTWSPSAIYDGALGQCDACGEVCTVEHPWGPEL